MIRILTQEDIKLIERLFDKCLEDYTLVYDTVIDNKFENDEVIVYGEFEGEELISLLLHNYHNLTYYASEVRNLLPYKEMLVALEYRKVTCESKFATKFQEIIEFDKVEESWFGYLYQDFNPTHEDVDIRFDCLNDAHDMINDGYFEYIIPEDEGVVARATYIANGSGQEKMYCLSREGKAISTAMIVMIQSNSAIVDSVITCEVERRKGLAGLLLSHIASLLYEDKKKMYLFYSNPVARNLYLKLGTKEVGSWKVLYRPSSKIPKNIAEKTVLKKIVKSHPISR